MSVLIFMKDKKVSRKQLKENKGEISLAIPLSSKEQLDIVSGKFNKWGAPSPIESTMSAIQNLSKTEQQEIKPWIAYMGREANTDLKQKSYYRSLYALSF